MKPITFAVAALTALLFASCTVDDGRPPAPASATSSSAPKPGDAAHAGDVWFQGSFAEGLAQAKATQKLVFVDFFTTWCPPCKKLDKETFTDAAVKAQLAELVSMSIDAESAAGVPVAKQFHVTGYPTLLVVDGNGKEVGRMVGFHPPEAFLAKLAEIRARKPR